jgi:hypothetical protein
VICKKYVAAQQKTLADFGDFPILRVMLQRSKNEKASQPTR